MTTKKSKVANRRRIPDAEVETLKRSGRRCCICFGLYGDLEIKRGQIAHLDRNPMDSSVDNLMFLCLEHHDQYDTRTSQSKGWTAKEAKYYRTLLYEAIEDLRGAKEKAGRNDTEQCVLPIISPIWSTSLFRTRSVVKSDTQRMLDETTTGLLDPGGVLLAFDVTNPNQLDMRIVGFCLDMLEYTNVDFVDIWKWSQGGGATYHEFSCTVEPKIGSYRCAQLTEGFDYVKLSCGELDAFRIKVKTGVQGVYRLRLRMQYSIGGRIDGVAIDDDVKVIGFIGRDVCDALYLKKAD
jgi:hypothetical protein